MPNVTCACCGASTKEQKAIPNVIFRDEDSPFCRTSALDGGGWPIRDERTLLVADAESCARPLEIPGKDAVRASGISVEEAARNLSGLNNGPEAGETRYKYAEGTGTVSMGKLREALESIRVTQTKEPGLTRFTFEAFMPPSGVCSFCGGAHPSEDHTTLEEFGGAPDRVQAKAEPFMFAKYPLGCIEFEPAPRKDPLRDALDRYALSIPGGLTGADVERFIIGAIEEGGKFAIDCKGYKLKSGN
jgi:hypothetical protein